MTKKYSSYKEHQLITENWRKYLNEEEGPEQSLGRWAQMFPRAAKALEATGARIEDIVQAIEDAQPEVDNPEAELRRRVQSLGGGGENNPVFEEEEK